MSDAAGSAILREFLIGQYEDLKGHLTRRLGSEDLAREALQETYLQLKQSDTARVVKRPKEYLLVIATNIARMSFRRERRWSSLEAIENSIGLVDDAPNPLQITEAREEIEALQRAFDSLTPRRQRILFAARIEGKQLREIAAELGVSQRLAEKELSAALKSCGASIGRHPVQRSGSQQQQASLSADDAHSTSHAAKPDSVSE